MTVTAEFAAPVERVWALYADPRRLERHWGPPGWPATFVQHELVPGARLALLHDRARRRAARTASGSSSRSTSRARSTSTTRSPTSRASRTRRWAGRRCGRLRRRSTAARGCVFVTTFAVPRAAAADARHGHGAGPQAGHGPDRRPARRGVRRRLSAPSRTPLRCRPRSGRRARPRWRTASGRAARPDASFLVEMGSRGRQLASRPRCAPKADLLARLRRCMRYVRGWRAARRTTASSRSTTPASSIGACWYRVLPRDEPGYGFVGTGRAGADARRPAACGARRASAGRCSRRRARMRAAAGHQRISLQRRAGELRAAPLPVERGLRRRPSPGADSDTMVKTLR